MPATALLPAATFSICTAAPRVTCIVDGKTMLFRDYYDRVTMKELGMGAGSAFSRVTARRVPCRLHLQAARGRR